MNKSELVACIYKHVGRTDDMESLTDMAEEIARMAADEERDACAALCEEVVTHPAGYGGQWEGYGPVKTQRDGKGCAAAIRARSNIQGEPGATKDD
jgi:hypothetical protein